MKVVTIFGTRPEMIKMWSTLKLLDESPLEHIMVHTGQNFSPELKDFFFSNLGLRAPDFEFGIDVSSYGREVADVIRSADELFVKVKPDALLILGDTYSALSVMPAAHSGIKVFHMEAGLRAYDKRMPEQRNRILIDHMSDINLPFHRYHRENLLREGIHPSRIIVTGNPTFEVMRAFAPQIENSDILTRLELTPGGYLLVTAHRSENVDSAVNLRKILTCLGALAKTFSKRVIYPMHPRTHSKLSGHSIPENVIIIPPLGFYDFNQLLKSSWCVLSDSGTAPEEALFYKIPAVSLRMTTERPETIEAGGHIVAGLEPDDVVRAVSVAVSVPWMGRYEFEEDFSPSHVVLNTMLSRITNFF